jgi:preprotein translocase subunit YajC
MLGWTSIILGSLTVIFIVITIIFFVLWGREKKMQTANREVMLNEKQPQ